MNHSNSSTDATDFPVVLVIMSTLLGGLVWLSVMLASVPQY